jgi:ABC-type antimicrobial peptide transport system permease subunit
VQNQFSIADYRDIRNQTSDVFSGLFGYQFGMDGLSVNGKPDRIMTNYVSGNFFSALEIQPALGRLILPSEGEVPSADPVMVLGYNYWKNHFGADPGIVGRKVSLDGRPVTIIGVAPKGFYGAYAASQKTHEIGVRLALGAQPMSILKTLLGQGMLIVGMGLVLGLAAAFAAAKVVGNFLAVSGTDPVTYTIVTALLGLVALAACYIPAPRAMRVDPMVALRYE